MTAPFKRSPELQASGRNSTVWLPKVSTELSAIVDSLEKAEVTIGFVLIYTPSVLRTALLRGSLSDERQFIVAVLCALSGRTQFAPTMVICICNYFARHRGCRPLRCVPKKMRLPSSDGTDLTDALYRRLKSYNIQFRPQKIPKAHMSPRD